jgi:hypothetical protein
MAQEKKTAQDAKAQPAGTQIRWDHSKMETTYANVCNVTSTREEVSVLFGTNKTLNVGQPGEINVELTDRIVMNPFTAKRFSMVLNKVVADYEAAHGALTL